MYPNLLQLFVWQDYDVAPRFPVLHGFLGHSRREIEAALHCIQLAHKHLIERAEWRAIGAVITIQ